MDQFGDQFNDRIVTRITAIGGVGGTAFGCLGIQRGKRLARLSIWAYDTKYITGLEETLSDGTNRLHGTKAGRVQEIYVGKDKLTSIKIQKEKPERNTRVGYICIHTDSGQTLEVNRPNVETPVETIDVGSGICFGLFGRSGGDVDSIGFAMLRPVQDSMMTDMHYPDIGTVEPSSEECEIMQETFTNASGKDQSFDASASVTFVEKSDWSIDFHLDLEATVVTKIPFLAEGKVTTKAGLKYVKSGGTSTSKTKSWTWPIVCPTNKMMTANATIKRRTVDLHYTATLAFKLNSGNTFKIPVTGTFQHADTADVVIVIKEHAIPK